MRSFIIILLVAATVVAVCSKSVEKQEREKRFHIPTSAEIKAKLKELVEKAKEDVNKAIDKVKDIYEAAKRRFEGDEKVIAFKKKLEEALNNLKANGELTEEKLAALWDKIANEMNEAYGKLMENEKVQAIMAKAKELWMSLASHGQAVKAVADAVGNLLSSIAVLVGMFLPG